MPDPLRILLDLSLAASGYAGIAQDARLNFRLLASLPNVKLTLLIYPARPAPIYKTLGHRLPGPTLMFLRSPTVVTLPLDADVDRVLLWEHFLSPTLPPSDRHLLDRCEVRLANLTHRQLFARAALGLLPPALLTEHYDAVLFHSAIPIRVSPRTRKLVRFYDMIPALFPKFVANRRVTLAHHLGLRQCATDATFVCGSDPTRDDLLNAAPALAPRTLTIPHPLPSHYYPEHNLQKLGEILTARRSSAVAPHPAAKPAGSETDPFILTVSTIEPRKNHLALLQAYNTLRPHYPGLKLVAVGNLGWKTAPILHAMRPLILRGDLVHLESVPPDDLRLLHSHARAFVTSSFYEGFGFPPLEALACGTPVAASDIPAHRYTLGDAPAYCNAHDPATIAAALHTLLSEQAADRDRRIARGLSQAQRFSLEALSPQWQALLTSPTS